MFSSVNFTGFDDATIEEIKEDCLIFLDFKIPAEYMYGDFLT